MELTAPRWRTRQLEEALGGAHGRVIGGQVSRFEDGISRFSTYGKYIQ